MKRILISVLMLGGLSAGESIPSRHDLADQPPPPAAIQRPLRQGAFTVPSALFANPTIACSWVRPEEATDPRAQDVVVYIPHPDDLAFAEPPGKGGIGTAFHQLARTCGFTVLGLRIQGQGRDAVSHLAPADAQRTYMDPGNGYGEALAAAIQHLRRELGLPERKVFAFGLSGGGILSQRLGERRGDLVEGAASLGGQSFWSSLKPHGAYLFVWTCGDSITEANQGAGVFYRRTATPAVLACSMPEWGRRGKPAHLFSHCIDGQGLRLAFRYLEGLSDLRRAHGNLPAESDRWPVLSSLRLRSTAYVRTAPDQAVPIAAADLVPFPSLACWAEWARIPGAPLAIRVGGAAAHLALPAATPCGLVLYRRGVWSDADVPLWNRTDPLDEHPEWDVRQLAAAGLAVLHADVGGPDLAALAAAGGQSLVSRPPLGACLVAPVEADLQALDALAGVRAVCLLQSHAEAQALAGRIAALRQRGVAVLLIIERHATDPKGRGDAIETLIKNARGQPEFAVTEVAIDGRSLGDRLGQELDRARSWLAQRLAAPAAVRVK